MVVCQCTRSLPIAQLTRVFGQYSHCISNVSLALIQRIGGTQYADGINMVLNPGCILNSSGYRTGGASCWMPSRSLVDTTLSLIMCEYAAYNEYALVVNLAWIPGWAKYVFILIRALSWILIYGECSSNTVAQKIQYYYSWNNTPLFAIVVSPVHDFRGLGPDCSRLQSDWSPGCALPCTKGPQSWSRSSWLEVSVH